MAIPCDAVKVRCAAASDVVDRCTPRTRLLQPRVGSDAYGALAAVDGAGGRGVCALIAEGACAGRGGVGVLSWGTEEALGGVLGRGVGSLLADQTCRGGAGGGVESRVALDACAGDGQ